MFTDKTAEQILRYAKIIAVLQVVIIPLSILFYIGLFFPILPVGATIVILSLIIIARMKSVSKIEKKKCLLFGIKAVLFQLVVISATYYYLTLWVSSLFFLL